MEGRAIAPDAVYDDRKLSAGGDGSEFEALPVAQPHRPGSQWRKAPDLADQSRGRGIEQPAEVAVAAFRDATGPVHISGLVRPRCQAKKRADVCGPAEPGRVIERGDIGECDDRADAGDGHQPPGKVTSTCNLSQLVVHGLGSETERLVNRVEHLGHEADCQLAFAGLGELVAKIWRSRDRRIGSMRMPKVLSTPRTCASRSLRIRIKRSRVPIRI